MFSFNKNELHIKKILNLFPKYQSINTHEKQLVIHKASDTSVVIRAGGPD